MQLKIEYLNKVCGDETQAKHVAVSGKLKIPGGGIGRRLVT